MHYTIHQPPTVPHPNQPSTVPHSHRPPTVPHSPTNNEWDWLLAAVDVETPAGATKGLKVARWCCSALCPSSSTILSTGKGRDAGLGADSVSRNFTNSFGERLQAQFFSIAHKFFFNYFFSQVSRLHITSQQNRHKGTSNYRRQSISNKIYV